MVRKFSNPVLLDQYRQDNPDDEIAKYIGIDFDPVKLTPVKRWVGLIVSGDDVNHILTNPRRDMRSNVITLSRRAHQSFHHNLRLGRVLCLLAKARKANEIGSPFEFVIADMNYCAGKSIAGWVENQKFAESWIANLQQELLRFVKKMRDIQ